VFKVVSGNTLKLGGLSPAASAWCMAKTTLFGLFGSPGKNFEDNHSLPILQQAAANN
jgi:hypothetical protein